MRQSVQHEHLLKMYGDAVNAFVDDFEKNDRFSKVLIMTFSEFGRRVSENASGGTDHGTANNLFVIVKIEKERMLNTTSGLSELDEGDLVHQVDFRSVYATLLGKWLSTESAKVLSGNFKMLDFI